MEKLIKQHKFQGNLEDKKECGKVKHELRVYGLWFQIHELRVQIYELRAQIHELRDKSTGYVLKFMSYEFKFPN